MAASELSSRESGDVTVSTHVSSGGSVLLVLGRQEAERASCISRPRKLRPLAQAFASKRSVTVVALIKLVSYLRQTLQISRPRCCDTKKQPQALQARGQTDALVNS